jgi:hypothetical protein
MKSKLPVPPRQSGLLNADAVTVRVICVTDVLESGHRRRDGSCHQPTGVVDNVADVAQCGPMRPPWGRSAGGAQGSGSVRKLGVIVAFVVFVGTLVGAGSSVAHAKSVRCDEQNVCKVYCTLNLEGGSWVEYPEGTEITVYDGSGEHKFKCVNGEWSSRTVSLPACACWGVSAR